MRRSQSRAAGRALSKSGLISISSSRASSSLPPPACPAAFRARHPAQPRRAALPPRAPAAPRAERAQAMHVGGAPRAERVSLRARARQGAAAAAPQRRAAREAAPRSCTRPRARGERWRARGTGRGRARARARARAARTASDRRCPSLQRRRSAPAHPSAPPAPPRARPRSTPRMRCPEQRRARRGGAR